MTTELGRKPINSWEWLDAFCLTQREDCHLACGQHAVVVVQIDNFIELRNNIGEARTTELLRNMEDILREYDMEDTLIARYNDYTFAVILHYLADRSEIGEMCEEIRTNINNSKGNWKDQITVSIGAAECHHDPERGYKCATELALKALAEARAKGDSVEVAPDTLPPHPLAVAMGNGSY